MTVRTLRRWLVAAAVLAIGAPAWAGMIDWYVGLGLDSAALDARAAEYAAAGFRPVSVSARGDAASARFDVLWHRDGAAGEIVQGLTAAELTSWLDTQRAQGKRAVCLAPYGAWPSELYAAAVVDDGGLLEWGSAHGLTYTEFQSAHSAFGGEGQRLRWIGACGTGDARRFAGVWTPGSPSTNFLANRASSTFDNDLINKRQNGDRLLVTAAYGTVDSPLFAGLWARPPHDEWDRVRGVDSGQLAATLDALVASGDLPLNIAGYETSAGLRYDACWVKQPFERKFTITGPEAPELKVLDDLTKAHMERCLIPNIAVAILKGNRLVMMRAYTYAYDGWPVTTPHTRFRIASMSKPTTAAGVFRLQEDGKLDADDLMTSYPGLEASAWTGDARVASITVRHLLQHTGGWDRGISFDPMFRDRIIATALGIPLPIGEWDIVTYMKARKLQHDPGTTFAYSNFGFQLAGLIEVSESAKEYERFMRQDVLPRVGVYSARVGASVDVRPDEAPYVDLNQARVETVMSPDGAYVPVCYGGFNMPNLDASGAWVYNAYDYARFLRAFADGKGALLSPESIGDMIARPEGDVWSDPYAYYACGFGVYDDGDVTWIEHDGGLPGTATYGTIGLKGDDTGAVILQNCRSSDTPGMPNPYQIIGDFYSVIPGVTEWPSGDLFPQFCDADFNHDGRLNINDFIAFQAAFRAGDDRADFSGDRKLNVNDFIAYQAAWRKGCN